MCQSLAQYCTLKETVKKSIHMSVQILIGGQMKNVIMAIAAGLVMA